MKFLRFCKIEENQEISKEIEVQILGFGGTVGPTFDFELEGHLSVGCFWYFLCKI